MSFRLWLVALPLLAACGGTPHPTFRAVFITDTHIIGPQYTCCVENGANDNASIVKTVDRLRAVRDAINAIDPPPAMVFVTGDVVHAAHVSRDPQWYRDNENAYSIARDLFQGFHMPVYMVMGNHDYEVDCGSSATFDRAFSEARFQEFFGMPPYQAVDYHGWKFLLVNSQRGPTFDVNDPRCSTEYASVGDEQMAWAQAQLDEGRPTVVMSHYMRILYNDAFPALLDAHDNVRAFFTGHTHRWLDMSGFNNDVPHWVLGGTRYDANNFWLVDFDETDGTFQILDQTKALIGSTCAMPIPTIESTLPDTGDCVSGT
jgi:3',5'-cyclic AMP phosphodiesterase CpdA